jgi:hypothetical protein
MSHECDAVLKTGILNHIVTKIQTTSDKSFLYTMARATYAEYQAGVKASVGVGGLFIIPVLFGLSVDMDADAFYKWQETFKSSLSASELETLNSTIYENVASQYTPLAYNAWLECRKNVTNTFGLSFEVTYNASDYAQIRIFWYTPPGGTIIKVLDSEIIGGVITDATVPVGKVFKSGTQFKVNTEIGATIKRNVTGALLITVQFDNGEKPTYMIPPVVTTFNAVIDFPKSDKTWEYGWSDKALSGFTPYTYRDDDPNLTVLRSGPTVGGVGDPSVVYNKTGTTLYYGGVSITQPSDMLNLHPGPAGEYSILRWIVPRNGNYFVKAIFEGLNSAGASTNIVIRKNATDTLFECLINGFGQSSRHMYSNYLENLVGGDIIDFCIGYGSNGNYGADSTGVYVEIKN